MGFETLKNIIEQNKELEEIGRQEAIRPHECPYCAWPTNTNSNGVTACPICGRIWS